MADVDLGALKFKIGLDDSGLDKQIKDIQKKLQDTFNQEMSFKPMLTDIGKMNDEPRNVFKEINSLEYPLIARREGTSIRTESKNHAYACRLRQSCKSI